MGNRETITKAEWDAVWPYEDLIRTAGIEPQGGEQLPVIPDGDERLAWVLPERDGGLARKDFDKLAQQHAECAAAGATAAPVVCTEGARSRGTMGSRKPIGGFAPKLRSRGTLSDLGSPIDVVAPKLRSPGTLWANGAPHRWILHRRRALVGRSPI